jgi:hypothetical protein
MKISRWEAMNKSYVQDICLSFYITSFLHCLECIAALCRRYWWKRLRHVFYCGILFSARSIQNSESATNTYVYCSTGYTFQSSFILIVSLRIIKHCSFFIHISLIIRHNIMYLQHQHIHCHDMSETVSASTCLNVIIHPKATQKHSCRF